VVKFHRKDTATAGHGAQVGGVAHHFGKRNVGVDGGLAMFGIHALNTGTAGVEIAHDIAHVGFRYGDRDAHDWFIEHRIGFFEGKLEGFAASNFEGDWFGIDGVFFSINN